MMWDMLTKWYRRNNELVYLILWIQRTTQQTRTKPQEYWKTHLGITTRNNPGVSRSQRCIPKLEQGSHFFLRNIAIDFGGTVELARKPSRSEEGEGRRAAGGAYRSGEFADGISGVGGGGNNTTSDWSNSAGGEAVRFRDESESHRDGCESHCECELLLLILRRHNIMVVRN